MKIKKLIIPSHLLLALTVHMTIAYILRLLEKTNAHASKTDTFTIGSSPRVHSSRLPNWSVYPRKGADANQSNESSTRCKRTYAFYYYFICKI